MASLRKSSVSRGHSSEKGRGRKGRREEGREGRREGEKEEKGLDLPLVSLLS